MWVAPCFAAGTISPGLNDTTAIADADLESHVIALCPELVRVILDHPPPATRHRQRRAVVLQHIDVLGQHDDRSRPPPPLAAISGVSDLPDPPECPLGLAFCK